MIADPIYCDTTYNYITLIDIHITRARKYIHACIYTYIHTYRSILRELAQAVKSGTYIREISRSYLDRNADYPEGLTVFLSLSKQITEQYHKLGHIPTKSLFTNIQTSDTTESEGLLTVSLRKL